MTKENNIPEQYQIKCENCGQIFDMRYSVNVFSHDNYNPKTGKYECRPLDEIYGDSDPEKTEWLQVKKPINLN